MNIAPNDVYADADLNHEILENFQSRTVSVKKQWITTYRSKFRLFLESFLPAHSVTTSDWLSYYRKAALHATRYGLKYIVIDIQHIYDWSEGTHLALFLQRNFFPLWKLLDNEVDQFVHRTLRQYIEKQQSEEWQSTLEDSGWKQFQAEDTLRNEDGEKPFLKMSDNLSFNEHLNYYAFFTFASPSYSIRELRCDFLGEFITLRGTTTRLSDVRPELKEATFECSQCHMVVENIEQQFKYTEPQACTNSQCKNRTSWILCPESCKFSDWQKMRLQENSSEIPAGSMPRIIEVIVTRALCDKCKPGDKVVIGGCLAAVPDVPSLMKPGELPKSVAIDRNRLARRTDMGGLDQGVSGLRKLGIRDLQYRLVFFALDIQTLNSGLSIVEQKDNDTSMDDWIAMNYDDCEPVEKIMTSIGVSDDMQRLFFDIAQSSDTLDHLAASIAPEVFGCELIKKGILTLFVGGVEKRTEKDRMKLRGDINICIVGDPGTAKSQLLKYVHQFVGRSVYAAGNTSTAAGLTVSIHKDPDHADVVIEAGALMLSDKGVCCIDEFDKMDAKDMVAIHEAMEQQTISICKAGIQATLNARASILAACNPRNGRYDTSKTFRHNVRLSAPVLSRFDLFFTILDSVDRDALVARHVVNLHTGNVNSVTLQESHRYPVLEKETLRMYLSICRSRRPRITPESKMVLVESYVAMRAESMQSYRAAPRVTIRQLESLIRLSEAVAKLKFSDVVLPNHVHEARRLIYACLLRLEKGTITLDDDSTDDTEDSQGEQDNQAEKKGASQQDLSFKRTLQTIDADEFERIAGTLIDHMRSLEAELKQTDIPHVDAINAVEAVVAKDDLITWYIENCTDATSTQEDLEREFTKLNKVIKRMVNRDFTLIEEQRDMYVNSEEDPNQTHIERVTALRLHPNLALDQPPSSDITETHHATLPTSFFNQEIKETSQEPSWTINDKDFIEYMYGWNDV